MSNLKPAPSMQMGMGMRMEIRLSQRQAVQQVLDLSDPEKHALDKALEYWTTKSHMSANFPFAEIQAALDIKEDETHQVPLDLRQSGLSEEFVMLTAAELKELDPDEKVGVRIGDYFFIEKSTLEDYVPMVVFNLAILKRYHESSAIAQVMKKAGVDLDTSGHWSANVADILLAERYFGENRADFAKYLEWRKSIERTEFFQNELVGEMLHDQLKYLEYKKTTHPMKRGKYARRSWALSGMLMPFGREDTDRHFRDFGIAKPDLIVRMLSESTNFDPEVMTRAIDAIIDTSETKIVSGHQHRSVRFEDASLARQAYLLTDEYCGKAGVLKNDSNEGHLFHVNRQADMTLRALKDRISYFQRQTLLKDSAVSPLLLSAIKQAKKLTFKAGSQKEVSIDLTEGPDGEPAKDEAAAALSAVCGQLQELEIILEGFRKVEERMGKLSGVKILPGNIEQEKQRLEEVRDTLTCRKTEIESALSLAQDIRELRLKQSALLSNLNLNEKASNETALLPSGTEG